MMERMIVPPVTVRSQRHDADDPADPIVGKTAAEKRTVAAVVLDHEETNEQARGRDRPEQANPVAKVERHPNQCPDDNEWHCGDRKLEAAAHAVRLAIAAEQLRQRAGFRRGNRAVLHPQQPRQMLFSLLRVRASSAINGSL